MCVIMTDKLEREFKGVWIPTAIWTNKELSLQEKVMIVEIDSLTKNDKGYCWASNKYFAEFFGLSTTRISHIISDLHKKNILEVWDIKKGKQTIQRRIRINNKYTPCTSATPPCENSKESNTNIIIHKRLSKDNRDSNESQKSNSDQSCSSKKILPKIVKKKVTLDTKKSKPKPKKKKTKPYKSLFTHTPTDLRNYNELKTQHNALSHNSGSNPELRTLDKLHALLDPACDNPYLKANYVPAEYIDFKWTLDDLIDIFAFQLDQANSPINNIGDFIFKKGYKNVKDNSPLLWWAQKMMKIGDNELSDSGGKLYRLLQKKKIADLKDYESSVFNSVTERVSELFKKYCFIDEGSMHLNYPLGIISVLGNYIKTSTVKNQNYKLFWMNKDTYPNEVIESAVKRNIIKKKSNGRRGVN